MLRLPTLATTFALCIATCAGPQATSAAPLADPLAKLPADADHAAEAITAAAIAGPIRFLASDLLEGRGAATRGDALARAYIASEFEALGLQPAGPNGGWEQPFDIIGMKGEVPATWNFKAGGKELALRFRDEFIAFTGVQQDSCGFPAAEVVFAGYAMQAPEYKWDDFKGADLRGKVLLILNNDPDWDAKLFAGKTRLYYGRWDYKYDSAARTGAAAAIIIHTRPSAGYPWQVVRSSWTNEQFDLPDDGRTPRLQVRAWVTEDAARRLVALAGKNLDKLVQSAHKSDFKPVPLGITTGLRIRNTLSRKRTANVLGLLPGSDPALREQVVIYSAHHDHLGIGAPDSTGDDIYNGALDNASGVAQMLAIAHGYRALAEPPRRSVLFLAVGTEESGLLGSEYYSHHPTFPSGRIAANVNIDGIDIWGRSRDLTLVGFGKSSLDGIAEAVAARQSRRIVADQFPDRGYFYRSDQFNFCRIGVPAFYFDSGTDFIDRPAGWGKEQIEAWESRHYHQPSDQFDSTWNLDGAVEDGRALFLCGLAVAQADSLPTWKPGDEFEAARKQALAAPAR